MGTRINLTVDLYEEPVDGRFGSLVVEHDGESRVIPVTKANKGKVAYFVKEIISGKTSSFPTLDGGEISEMLESVEA